MPSPYTTISAATVTPTTVATPVVQAVTKQLCSIDITVTNGSTVQDPNALLRVWVASTPLTITDTNVRKQVKGIHPFEFRLSDMAASETNIFQIPEFIAKGGNVWIWYDTMRLLGNISLTATLVEIA